MKYDIGKQLEDIKKDIGKTSHLLAQKTAEYARKDLETARNQIIDDFYSYELHSPEHNQRTYLLKYVVRVDKLKCSGNNVQNKYSASLTVNGSLVTDTYGHGSSDNRVSADYVTDLIWFQGIRGLPENGSHNLEKSFTFAGHSFNEGQPWKNYFWDQNEYENIFTTSVKIGNLKTIEATPDKVMDDFINKWGKQRMSDVLNKVNKEIKNI